MFHICCTVPHSVHRTVQRLLTSASQTRDSLPRLILLILPHCDSHGALSTEALRTARHALNRTTVRCRRRLCKQIHIFPQSISQSSTVTRRACSTALPGFLKFTPSVCLPQTRRLGVREKEVQTKKQQTAKKVTVTTSKMLSN